MNELQTIPDPADDVTIYNNPAATRHHEQGHRFYAVAPEGCGSYGATPEEARELLAVVQGEYAGSDDAGRAALRDLAAERVGELTQAGGSRIIDEPRKEDPLD